MIIIVFIIVLLGDGFGVNLDMSGNEAKALLARQSFHVIALRLIIK